MKIGIGLAAAFAIAILSPSASYAQAGKITDKARTQGMAEVPAILPTSGVDCTLADAAFLGEGQAQDAAGKKVKNKLYEIACTGGSGYVVGAPVANPISCLALETVAGGKKGALLCQLPANANARAPIVALGQKAGITCTVDKARWVGTSATSKTDIYELGCADGQSSVLVLPLKGSTATLAVEPCIRTMSGDGKGMCQYMTTAQADAYIGALAAKSGRACTVSGVRHVGTKKSGEDYFEIGCSDGKSGYMMETTAGGAYKAAVPCAGAEGIAGGCKLTQVAVEGSTEESALYTKNAKAIGYDCTVKSYRSMGIDATGRELVELACSNRPDGAFAYLPVSAGQKGETVNCMRAEARQLTCRLSNKTPFYEKLANQLQNKGKTCKISGTRGIGLRGAGNDVIEVGCTGSTGVVVTYAGASEAINDMTQCAAFTAGGGCQLK